MSLKSGFKTVARSPGFYTGDSDLRGCLVRLQMTPYCFIRSPGSAAHYFSDIALALKGFQRQFLLRLSTLWFYVNIILTKYLVSFLALF